MPLWIDGMLYTGLVPQYHCLQHVKGGIVFNLTVLIPVLNVTTKIFQLTSVCDRLRPHSTHVRLKMNPAFFIATLKCKVLCLLMGLNVCKSN